MDTPRAQKVIIGTIQLLKLAQFILQFATVFTSAKAYDKSVFIWCLILNIVATFGNICMFIYHVAEARKFEFEKFVFGSLLAAYLITGVVLLTDLKNIFKSNNTVDLQVTQDTYAGDSVDYKPVDYEAVFKKAVTFMIIIIVVECIFYYLAQIITYDKPIQWFWAECFAPYEEQIPLAPHSQPIAVSQVVVNPPSVTRKTPRTSQRDSLDTEEIDCEGAVRYIPQKGIDLPKKSVAEGKPKKDGDNLTVRYVPQEGIDFPKKSVAEGKPQKDGDNSGAVSYLPQEGIDFPKKSVAEGKPQKDGDDSPTDVSRIKRKQFRQIGGEASQHQCSDFQKLEFSRKKDYEPSHCSNLQKSPK